MNHVLQTEWLKTKRTSSRRLLWVGPLIFIVFCYLMTLMMGSDPSGRSYLMAVAFNWFPSLIFPIMVALLVVNNWRREQDIHHMNYKSHHISIQSTFLAKTVVVLLQMLIIISLSSLMILALNFFVIKSHINIYQLALSSLALFIGSLPTVGLCIIVVREIHPAIIYIIALVVNFIPAAIIAVKPYWIIYPWTYVMRMMAVTVGVHPNGTFLPANHEFLAKGNLIIGTCLSLIVFSVFLFIGLFVNEKEG